MLRQAVFTTLVTVACTLGGTALAQTYPDRPIKLYQGFAAGGNADTIARLIGSELTRSLGQPVVVEAQSGAGGTIAATTVARAKPDGYTLLLATGGHSVAGALYGKLAYQTVDDFTMVSTATFFPFLMVVRADSPYTSLQQILAAARADPKRISYGTAGVGTTHHLAGELLAKMAAAPMLHVPYRGDAASVTALIGGEIPFIIAPPTAVMANIRAGRLRAVATSGIQRWPGLPELATVAEQGTAGYDVTSWAGVMAPAGTARPIIDKLNAAIQKALTVADVRSRLEDMGGVVRGGSPEAMTTLVGAELRRWTSVVDEAKIPKQ